MNRTGSHLCVDPAHNTSSLFGRLVLSAELEAGGVETFENEDKEAHSWDVC